MCIGVVLTWLYWWLSVLIYSGQGGDNDVVVIVMVYNDQSYGYIDSKGW